MSEVQIRAVMVGSRSRTCAAADSPDAVLWSNRSTTGTRDQSTPASLNAIANPASRDRCTWKCAACCRSTDTYPSLRSRARRMQTTPMRRWPIAIRCRASSFIADRSSMPTRSTLVRSGWSHTTVGTGRSRTAARCGSSSGTE